MREWGKAEGVKARSRWRRDSELTLEIDHRAIVGLDTIVLALSAILGEGQDPRSDRRRCETDSEEMRRSATRDLEEREDPVLTLEIDHRAIVRLDTILLPLASPLGQG